jgi:hypothetical protein
MLGTAEERAETTPAVAITAPVAVALRQRHAWLWALAAGAAAALLSAVLELLRTHKLYSSVFNVRGGPGSLTAYACLTATVVVVWLVPARWRRPALTVASLLAGALLLRTGMVAVLAYALALCVVARRPWSLRAQLLVSLILWAAGPIARWYLLPPAWHFFSYALGMVWAGLLFSTLFLLIERRRQSSGDSSLVDDLFYLLALPRLVEPFAQPISRRYLLSTARANFDWHLLRRGLGLGLLAALLSLVGIGLRKLGPGSTPAAGAVPAYTVYYCNMARTIFGSMALFRLLGYDMASGFRYHLLSTSFSDFFRRWNHYVRDAVLSLFLFPLIGWLRPRLGKTAATVIACYTAIIVGAFAMHDLLVPFIMADSPRHGVAAIFEPTRFVLLFVLWTGIVVPVVLGRKGQAAPSGTRRIWARVRFLAIYFAVWGVAWWQAGFP